MRSCLKFKDWMSFRRYLSWLERWSPQLNAAWIQILKLEINIRGRCEYCLVAASVALQPRELAQKAALDVHLICVFSRSWYESSIFWMSVWFNLTFILGFPNKMTSCSSILFISEVIFAIGCEGVSFAMEYIGNIKGSSHKILLSRQEICSFWMKK